MTEELDEFVAWKDERLERLMLKGISLDIPWSVVERFSKLERQSGSPEERKGFEILMAHLREWGVPHTLHEPLCLISLPGPAYVRPEKGDNRYQGRPPAMSLSTEGREITAPLVYLGYDGDATTQDFWETGVNTHGVDVRGAIVITEGMASPRNVAELTEAGALAGIFINPGEYVHEGICTPIWGTPDLTNRHMQPQLPVVAVSNSTGRELIAVSKRGERVALATSIQTEWRAVPVLVAEIQGVSTPDEFVLLHGHLDSWYYGVGDNATGDAALLAIARAFQQQRSNMHRSLRIAWWSGHSHGRYAGSTWYADTFALDLAQHCVAQINCDSPGCRGATTYDDLTAMSEAQAFVDTVIRDTTGITPHTARPPRGGDYSFNSIGITSLYMLSSTMSEQDRLAQGYYIVGGCGGNIQWHTPDDLLSIADPDILLRDIRMYAASVLRTLNAPLHPWDWRRTTEDFTGTINRYADAAGTLFDFGPSRNALAELSSELDRFYSQRPGGDVGDSAVRRWNAVQRRLGRHLIPVNYSKAEPFFHDPAIELPLLPDLNPALQLPHVQDPGERQILQTHLTRGQNRLVWTLTQACEKVWWARTSLADGV